MNANANNNLEDPIFEGQYEYRGQENYSPTPNFLKKVYFVLDVQLSIVLALHLLLGLLTISTNLYTIIFSTAIKTTFSLFIAFHTFFQVYWTPKLKASPIKCLIFFAVRTIFFYAVIRAYIPTDYFKQITLFISLILSLHLAFTTYVLSMRTTYERKSAFYWLVVWMMVATGFLYVLKGVLVPGIFTNFAILLNVFFVFLYGLYLIFETGFILDGILYQVNHHEYIFGALILQFDLMGIAFWAVKKCKKNNQRN